MTANERTCENESLLVRRDSLLVLNLGLHVLDRIRGLHFESDCFSSKRLHENLHVCKCTAGNGHS